MWQASRTHPTPPSPSCLVAADIRYEMERAGRVLEVIRDPKARCALVEFDR